MRQVPLAWKLPLLHENSIALISGETTLFPLTAQLLSGKKTGAPVPPRIPEIYPKALLLGIICVSTQSALAFQIAEADTAKGVEFQVDPPSVLHRIRKFCAVPRLHCASRIQSLKFFPTGMSVMRRVAPALIAPLVLFRSLFA